MVKTSQVKVDTYCRNCGKQTYHGRPLCTECGDKFKCTSCGIVCYPGYPEEKRFTVGEQHLCSGCKSRLKLDGKLLLEFGYCKGKLLFRSGFTKRPNRPLTPEATKESLLIAMKNAGLQFYKD